QWYRSHTFAGRDVVRNPVRHLLPSGCLPDLERTLTPAKSPTNRQIKITCVIRDTLKMNRTVMQHVTEDRPNELRLRMLARTQLRKALRNILVLQNRNDGLISFAPGKPVRSLFKVEHLY